MKRRTKAIVFFASMALTLGSLTAIVGSRHHICAPRHNSCMQDQGVANPVIQQSTESVDSESK